jgi:hypothetical protein
MSKQKHTPGPWNLSDGANGEWQVTAPDAVDLKGEDWSVAMVFGSVGHDGGNGESDANARLIAAAPDLLEAAELLEKAEDAHTNCVECEGEEVPELCPKCFPLFDDARISRRLAITKATGSAALPPTVPGNEGKTP